MLGKFRIALLALALSGCAASQVPTAGVTPVASDTDRSTIRRALADHNLNPSAGALRPGDLVQVKFVFAPELNIEQRVMSSGHLSLPLVGLVEVTGKGADTILSDLKGLYAQQLQRPDLTFSVLEYGTPLPTPRVYVMGAVREGGAFPVDDPITFLEALALAGGRTELAHNEAVAIIRIRDEQIETEVTSVSRLLGGEKKAGPTRLSYILPGDIVFVPQSRLATAAQISLQLQDLFAVNGISGNASYRLDDEEFNIQP